MDDLFGCVVEENTFARRPHLGRMPHAASLKREPMEPIQSATAAAIDPTGLVAAEVPCRRCGYLLQMLHISGLCPECGTPVGVSLRSDLVRFSEPAWARRLARGVWLIVGAVNLAIASFVTMFIWLAVMIATSNTSGLTKAMIALSTLLTLGALAAWICGVWLSTSRDPGCVGEESFATPRKLTRVATIVVFGYGLIRFQLLRGLFTRSMVPFVGGADGLIVLLLPIGLIALLRHLRQLALRVPDPKLTNELKTLSWKLGCAAGFAATLRAVSVVAPWTSNWSNPSFGVPNNPFIFLHLFLSLAMLQYGWRFFLSLRREKDLLFEQAQLAAAFWAIPIADRPIVVPQSND